MKGTCEEPGEVYLKDILVKLSHYAKVHSEHKHLQCLRLMKITLLILRALAFCGKG